MSIKLFRLYTLINLSFKINTFANTAVNVQYYTVIDIFFSIFKIVVFIRIIGHMAQYFIDQFKLTMILGILCTTSVYYRQ